MASNLNIVLSGLILQVIQNTDASQRVSSPITVTLPGSEATYIDYLPIAAGGTVLTLPNPTIWVLVVFSLGGINASPAGNITVQRQVTGGGLVAAASSELVLPSGLYVY